MVSTSPTALLKIPQGGKSAGRGFRNSASTVSTWLFNFTSIIWSLCHLGCWLCICVTHTPGSQETVHHAVNSAGYNLKSACVQDRCAPGHVNIYSRIKKRAPARLKSGRASSPKDDKTSHHKSPEEKKNRLGWNYLVTQLKLRPGRCGTMLPTCVHFWGSRTIDAPAFSRSPSPVPSSWHRRSDDPRHDMMAWDG